MNAEELTTLLGADAMAHIMQRGVNLEAVRPPVWPGEMYRVQLPGLEEGTHVPVYKD